jgi:hypothetical protein
MKELIAEEEKRLDKAEAKRPTPHMLEFIDRLKARIADLKKRVVEVE